MNIKRIHLGRLLTRVFLLGWVGFSIFLLLWILLSAFKTNQEFFDSVIALPRQWSPKNFVDVLVNENALWRTFLNSFFVVISSVLALLCVSAPAAYVLSRFSFFAASGIRNYIVFGIGIPFQLLIVPLFATMYSIRLINSLFGLGVVYVSLSIPFTVYLLIPFFSTMPSSLEEAARIDGCSPMRCFLNIILPVSRNGLATAAVLNFVGLWNEFLFALTLIYSQEKFTVSLGLYAIQGGLRYTGNWVGMMAAFSLVALPTLLLYVFLSNMIMRGLTAGAVKG